MSSQTEIWVREEGDEWLLRNYEKLAKKPDRVLELVKELLLDPKMIYEVGCAHGWRLSAFQDWFGCEAHGCDVSRKALSEAQRLNPKLVTAWREATHLQGVKASHYDMVIYGFVLYACEPKDLHRIVAESDRILKDGGHLVIYDFAPEHPHSRGYSHSPNLRTYKMQHERLWLASPSYALVDQRIYPHEDGEEITEDTRVAVSILKKNITQAFPLKS